jgi:hypothetical protein
MIVRVEAAYGQAGVVGQYGAGPGDDRVTPGAQAVDVLACGRTGDPLAGAVGGGRPAVEGGGELPGDVGTPQSRVGQPLGVDVLGLGGEQPGLDLDAGLGQPPGAAPRAVAGIGHRVHDAPYAGVQDGLGAWSGAAVVVTGFEGDDDGAAAGALARLFQGGGLGVRAAGEGVVSLPRAFSGGVEHDASDDGIGTGLSLGTCRQRDRVAHRRSYRGRCGGHPEPPVPGSGVRPLHVLTPLTAP